MISLSSIRLGFLAKLISLSFYLFIFSRPVSLTIFPENITFPITGNNEDIHLTLLSYSLYYYSVLMLACLIFENRSVKLSQEPISKELIYGCLLYFILITIVVISNNNLFSFSNKGYSKEFLILKKVWDHSSFALIVLLLFYTGFIKRIFLATLFVINFLYYPSKAAFFSIAGPIYLARVLRNKEPPVRWVFFLLILFIFSYVLADTVRVNRTIDFEFMFLRITQSLFNIMQRIGFNYDMALHYGDQFLDVFYAIDIFKSVINGYVPGEIFKTNRIFSGSDLHALKYGIDLEQNKIGGGGFNLGFLLFDRAYFGYFAPIISLVFLCPIIYVYNRGNIVYKVIVAFGLFQIGNGDSFIFLLKILNNLLLFYIFSLMINKLKRLLFL